MRRHPRQLKHLMRLTRLHDDICPRVDERVSEHQQQRIGCLRDGDADELLQGIRFGESDNKDNTGFVGKQQ